MTVRENRDRSVLIPTGWDPASYPCIRSLSRRNIHTIVASERDRVPEFGSRYCDETVTLPSPQKNLSAYKDSLLDVAARSDVETIVPIREHDIYVFSKYEAEFAEHVSLVAPALDKLRTVHDRVELFDAAEAAGVPAPDTRLLSDVDQWDEDVIVKSRYNLLTNDYHDDQPPNEVQEVKGVRYVQAGESPDEAAIIDEMGHEPIVQEHVPKSNEFMFAGIYDHGEPLATFQHEQIRGNSYVGGGGVYRKSIYRQDLEDVARRLLGHLEWHGLACIEYMEHAETGELVLTEINPRMWQSLPATVRADADFPYYYWLQSQGRQAEIDPQYNLGVGSHLLIGEFSHLLSIVQDDSPFETPPSLWESLREVVASCYQDPNFDYLRPDDPVTFAYGIREFFSRLGGADRKNPK